MPLTKRQFELGVDEKTESLMRQIYELLSRDRNLAYSEAELVEMMKGDPGDVIRAMETLERVGAVEVRQVGREYYYAFYQEVDQATWQPESLAPF